MHAQLATLVQLAKSKGTWSVIITRLTSILGGSVMRSCHSKLIVWLTEPFTTVQNMVGGGRDGIASQTIPTRSCRLPIAQH